MRLFLISVLLLFSACNGQKKAAMEKAERAGNDSLELVVRDDYSGSDISETLIITNAKALKAFFSKVNRTRKPGLPVPEVDFSKDLIVIQCSGTRNDGALPVLFVREETPTQMIIGSALEPNDKMTSEAITSPFSVYKMPLTEKEISFEEKKK